MTSKYLIQIKNKDTGHVVRSWVPGLSVEKEFEAELLNRVQAKGVGVFRTEAHVLQDLRDAIREMLHELKAQV